MKVFCSFFALLYFLQYHLLAMTDLHIVINSHLDLTWGMHFSEIYYGTGGGTWYWVCVKCLYDDLMTSLSENSERKFTISETYFTHLFYYETLAGDEVKRQKLKDLFKNKQFIFGQSGLCIHDQATTHYDEIIDQLTFGLRFAFELFHEEPRDGWSLDIFGVSYTNTVLLRQFGGKTMVMDRISEGDRSKRINEKRLEFFWGSESFMTHILPYNYGARCDDFEARDKIENMMFQEHFPNTGNSMVIFTDDFKKWPSSSFQKFEEQMKYYKDHPETGINMFYSSTSDYFQKEFEAHDSANVAFPYQEPYTDFYPMVGLYEKPWVGYYSTRPHMKYLVRRYGILSRGLKHLFSIMSMEKKHQSLFLTTSLYQKCVNDVELHIGFLTHHDTITGTLSHDSEQDVKGRTYRQEVECRQEINNASISENYTYCYNLDNNNSCIIDLFKNNPNLQNDFIAEKQNIRLRLFNPGKSQNDIIYFRIPDLKIKATNLTGVEIDSDAFCELANGLECFLYIKSKFHGLEFTEFILKYDGPGAIEKTVTQFPELDSVTIDLNFGFQANLVVEPKFSKFHYTSPTIQKTFYLDLKYYESKRTQNCHFFDEQTGGWSFNCAEYHAYSGVYVMRLENGQPKNFKDEMNIQGYYYRTKFFLRITIQYNTDNFITQLTFYPDNNQNSNVFIIDLTTFLNDNLKMDYSQYSGKEMTVTVKLEDLKNDKTYYTDSNGLYYMKRNQDHSYNNDARDIPLSYFPVVSHISINNENDTEKSNKTSLMILNDRSEGGTSFREGEVELMFNRYIYTDDGLGLCENITLQEKNYINHQIIIQDYTGVPNNETMVELINKKNFLYIPFVKLSTDEQGKTEKIAKELDKVLVDVPFYIKINIHPLNNDRFIIRVQDLYHPDDKETIEYINKIKDSLKKPCQHKIKCKYSRYSCSETLLGGLINEKDDLNDTKHGEIPHRIRTLFCQKMMD